MTAQLSLTKKAYFAVWHEGCGGRGANNMASAVVRILQEIVNDHPDIGELTLWSDSCVCQNRNSVMTMALSLFVQESDSIHTVIQKFCEAGHSSIQEVDSVHSVIERHLRYQEVHSPLALVKKLSTLKNTKTIQMTKFLDYQSKARKEFKFGRVPYTQVRQLKISKVAGVVHYKKSHDVPEWITVSVKFEARVSTRKSPTTKGLTQTPLKLLEKPKLSTEKKKDLTSMLPYVPELDGVYLETVVKEN